MNDFFGFNLDELGKWIDDLEESDIESICLNCGLEEVVPDFIYDEMGGKSKHKELKTKKKVSDIKRIERTGFGFTRQIAASPGKSLPGQNAGCYGPENIGYFPEEQLKPFWKMIREQRDRYMPLIHLHIRYRKKSDQYVAPGNDFRRELDRSNKNLRSDYI